MANLNRSAGAINFWEMCQLMALLHDRYPGFISQPEAHENEQRLNFKFWDGKIMDLVVKGNSVNVFLNDDPDKPLLSPTQLIENKLKEFLDVTGQAGPKGQRLPRPGF